MAKYFPVIRTVTNTVIIGDSAEVQNERLQYDLPEIHTTPTDAVSAVVDVQESSPAPEELGILAVLLLANETHPAATDPTWLEVEVLTESHPASTDTVSVVGHVDDSHPVASDEITAFALVLDELLSTPVEDVTGTEAIVVVDESHPASTHTTAIEIDVQESTPAGSDVVTLGAVFAETHTTPVEDVAGTEAIVQVNDSHAAPGDTVDIESDVQESVPDSTDAGYIEVTGNLWPGTTNTTTGFSNGSNAVDKDTSSAATCSASSSGLGNLTSNTTNGTLVISAPDPNLSDLGSITSAVIRVSTTADNSGSLSGQAIDMDLDYSVNDGSSWTNIATINTLEGAQTRTLDITTVINDDWGKVDGFRLRATGSVTSGIGTTIITGTTTFSFHYGRLELVAEDNY